MSVNFKNWNDILENAKYHGLKMPEQRLQIKISEADKKFRWFFEKILSMRGETYHHCPEYDEVISWLSDSRGKGLFLYGDCGRGKSIIVRYLLPVLLMNEMRKILKPVDITAIDSKKKIGGSN